MTSRHFVFIEADKRGKTKKSDRKLIRSQCMTGKNTRIGVGPTHAEESAVAGRPISGSLGRLPSLQPARNQLSITSHDPRDVQPADVYKKLAQLPVPRSPKSDLSVLADSTNTGASLHLLHFLTHASHIIFPTELCVDFDLGQSNGLRWIFEDVTYLHFTLFFTSAINDVFMRRPLGKTTYYHMGRTIAYLNEKVSASELGDSTIAVVSSLVIVCATLADFNAAKAHFAGLRHLVRLRGGFDAFRHDLGLYIKLARVDFAYTLNTGQSPLFLDSTFLSRVQESTTASLYCQGDRDTDAGDHCNPTLDDNSDIHLPVALNTLIDDRRVASVFSDLRRISANLNHQRRLQDSDFKLAICSIQYRLLSLENTVDGKIAECLRLAMLVFLTTTFQMPEGAGQRYPYLSDKFRKSCCTVLAEDSNSEIWNDFAMWLLVIGGVSLYGVDENWLQESWTKVVPISETWSVARRRLRRFLWIDVLHDRLGEELFDMLNQKDTGERAVTRSKASAWWLSGWGICPLEL